MDERVAKIYHEHGVPPAIVETKQLDHT